MMNLSEDNRLSAQFYSSSSTGLLLWMFEKVPHPVIITLIILGCMTSFGDISDSIMLHLSSVVLCTAFSLQVLCLPHLPRHHLRS